MNDAQLRTSKAIHRRTGQTFYLATRLFPAAYRHPTYVLYAFFRTADEVVDGPANPGPAEQEARLEAIRAAVLGDRVSRDPVLAAFREVKADHGIPDAEVNAFLDAMLADARKRRYRTYEELDAYMDGSAAAVGAMMTAVMDPEEFERALPHARALGKAFQLTNFVRDVREDVVEHGRIYLPLSTFERHGVTEAQVRSLAFSEGVAGAVAEELYRAERLYEDGVAGIRYLPDDGQLPVLFAAVLYAEHHRLVRRRGYDVFSAVPELSTAHKLAVAARVGRHWRRDRDPEAVFRATSAVDWTGSTGDGPRGAERGHRHPEAAASS